MPLTRVGVRRSRACIRIIYYVCRYISRGNRRRRRTMIRWPWRDLSLSLSFFLSFSSRAETGREHRDTTRIDEETRRVTATREGTSRWRERSLPIFTRVSILNRVQSISGERRSVFGCRGRTRAAACERYYFLTTLRLGIEYIAVTSR